MLPMRGVGEYMAQVATTKIKNLGGILGRRLVSDGFSSANLLQQVCPRPSSLLLSHLYSYPSSLFSVDVVLMTDEAQGEQEGVGEEVWRQGRMALPHLPRYRPLPWYVFPFTHILISFS